MKKGIQDDINFYPGHLDGCGGCTGMEKPGRGTISGDENWRSVLGCLISSRYAT